MVLSKSVFFTKFPRANLALRTSAAKLWISNIFFHDYDC